MILVEGRHNIQILETVYPEIGMPYTPINLQVPKNYSQRPPIGTKQISKYYNWTTVNTIAID